MKKVALLITIATMFAACSNNNNKSGLLGGDSTVVSEDTTGIFEIEDSIALAFDSLNTEAIQSTLTNGGK
jgi:hypothetical protein